MIGHHCNYQVTHNDRAWNEPIIRTSVNPTTNINSPTRTTNTIKNQNEDFATQSNSRENKSSRFTIELFFSTFSSKYKSIAIYSFLLFFF